MASSLVHFAGPGCVVEYLEGNAVQIALVTEEAGGRVRLFLPNRREARLQQTRLLPWLGPQLAANMGKEEAVKALEAHKARREELAAAVPALEVWDLAQGEVDIAPAQWFAELFVSEPDVDQIAAYGRALLQCKTHFRFQPPDFQIYTAEDVERRMGEKKVREEREAMISGGAQFFRTLWEAAGRRALADLKDMPAEPVATRLRELLLTLVANPDDADAAPLWQMLTKGLPDVPHLPLQLLMAWGVLPPHHNFWLNRAGYDAGDDWWQAEQEQVKALATPDLGALPACEIPFVSIDSPTTRDIDDSFFVEKTADGYVLTLALACPALFWPFGSALDRLVLHRGTSIYLPEGTLHMLPGTLGVDGYSLLAGQERPALVVRMPISGEGNLGDCDISLARVRLAANLNYGDCEDVLEARACEDNPALPFAEQLRLADALAVLRRDARIRDGAVIMERPDQDIELSGEGWDTKVDVQPTPAHDRANLLVAEGMIAASAAVALWAASREIPMLHRTQDVALPPEYAGIWRTPHDMTRIMRALAPSALEVQARPHAALALPDYTPVTSPLRRYPDLVNEAQILAFLANDAPRWSREQLEQLLLQNLNPALEAAGQVQRFRPRYWKLLFFRQQGDKKWWPATITEENEHTVSVSLTDQGLFVRGKRRFFDERAYPGMAVQVRIGKVYPLLNEIQVLEAISEE